MAKLIDSLNNVIATGTEEYVSELHRVLLADPEDVSEEDEIRFETELRSLSWAGSLIVIAD
jgi:hypothetical protein